MAIINQSNNRLPSVQYAMVDFSDFLNGINTQYDDSIMPIRYALECSNFSTDKGVLKTGLGLKKLVLPISIDDPEGGVEMVEDFEDAEPLKVMHFRFWEPNANEQQNRILIYLSDGRIIWRRMYDNFNLYIVLPNLTFTSVPNLLNYRLNDDKDIGIFMSKTDHLKVWGPKFSIMEIEDAPLMTSMCLHFERLFATVEGKNTSIWFSDSMDPTNWNVSSTEAGYFHLYDTLGGANKIISFNNYLYIFRDFGITKVTAYAEQSSFTVSNIYTSSNVIFADTACICGDNVFFLASDGLYGFDGAGVKKLNLNFEGIFDGVDNSKAQSEFHKNCYYLLCNTKYSSDEDYLGTLLELNVETGALSLLTGYKFVSMTAIRNDLVEKLIVIIRNNQENILTQLTHDGLVLGEATTKKWKSAMTDLGEPNKIKTIKSISLISEYDCTVELETENKKISLNIKGNPLPQRRALNLTGSLISVGFITKGQNAKISHPEMEICYK